MATYYNEDSGEEDEVSSFQSLAAEGDILAKQGDFRKAIQAYTKALKSKTKEKNGEKNCWVSRSKCYLQLGDSESALRDAEHSLADDPTYFKGIFQKGEALYAKGDFELALVFYHRGNKLRPELDEFRLGIQKAGEAIDNSIGNPKDYKLRPPGKGTGMTSAEKGDDRGEGMAGSAPDSANRRKMETAISSGGAADSIGGNGEKTMKQLLGELYADREYLQQLVSDKTFNNDPEDPIIKLVTNGLKYLDSRKEFWRQQKPMYARRKEQRRIQVKVHQARVRQDAAQHKKQEKAEAAAVAAAQAAKKVAHVKPHHPHGGHRSTNNEGVVQDDTTKYILESWDFINKAMEDGDHAGALTHAQEFLAKILTLEIVDKQLILTNLYSCIGNIYLGLLDFEQALLHHKKDLEIAQQNNYKEAVSRALGNCGRSYAKLKEYRKAMDCWELKIPMTDSEIESAWLYHDIGRCHMALGEFEEAIKKGEKSLAAAASAGELRWQLNATILLGQANVRSQKFSKGLEYYVEALKFAKELEDRVAATAITKAIGDVKTKIEVANAQPAASTTGGADATTAVSGSDEKMDVSSSKEKITPTRKTAAAKEGTSKASPKTPYSVPQKTAAGKKIAKPAPARTKAAAAAASASPAPASTTTASTELAGSKKALGSKKATSKSKVTVQKKANSKEEVNVKKSDAAISKPAAEAPAGTSASAEAAPAVAAEEKPKEAVYSSAAEAVSSPGTEQPPKPAEAAAEAPATETPTKEQGTKSNKGSKTSLVEKAKNFFSSRGSLKKSKSGSKNGLAGAATTASTAEVAAQPATPAASTIEFGSSTSAAPAAAPSTTTAEEVKPAEPVASSGAVAEAVAVAAAPVEPVAAAPVEPVAAAPAAPVQPAEAPPVASEPAPVVTPAAGESSVLPVAATSQDANAPVEKSSSDATPGELPVVSLTAATTSNEPSAPAASAVAGSESVSSSAVQAETVTPAPTPVVVAAATEPAPAIVAPTEVTAAASVAPTETTTAASENSAATPAVAPEATAAPPAAVPVTESATAPGPTA